MCLLVIEKFYIANLVKVSNLKTSYVFMRFLHLHGLVFLMKEIFYWFTRMLEYVTGLQSLE